MDCLKRRQCRTRCVTHPLNPPPVRGTFVYFGKVSSLSLAFSFRYAQNLSHPMQKLRGVRFLQFTELYCRQLKPRIYPRQVKLTNPVRGTFVYFGKWCSLSLAFSFRYAQNLLHSMQKLRGVRLFLWQQNRQPLLGWIKEGLSLGKNGVWCADMRERQKYAILRGLNS